MPEESINYCIATNNGEPTLLKSNTALTPTVWFEYISNACYVYDKMEDGSFDESFIVQFNSVTTLESINKALNNGFGSLELIAILYPETNMQIVDFVEADWC